VAPSVALCSGYKGRPGCCLWSDRVVAQGGNGMPCGQDVPLGETPGTATAGETPALPGTWVGPLPIAEDLGRDLLDTAKGDVVRLGPTGDLLGLRHVSVGGHELAHDDRGV